MKKAPRRTTRTKSPSLRKNQAWQLQEAKARFSEVIRLSLEEGPQRVTKHGEVAVVVVSMQEYDRLVKRKQPKGKLSEFFAQSPLAGSGISLEREPEYAPDIDL